MAKGFKDKDGKFHPTEKSHGISSKQVSPDLPPFIKDPKQRAEAEKQLKIKIEKMKEHESRKKEGHLFRIFQFESNEGGGDRQEVAHVRAKDIDEATEFVKNHYIKKEFRDKINDFGDADFSAFSVSTPFDENGNELTEKQVEKLQDEGKEDDINWSEDGFEIQEDDDEKDDFQTIFGGNDFFDLTKPKGEQSEFTTEDAIKKAGSANEAFFEIGSGQGFESGNKDNDFNLNTSKLDLFDPETNPKPRGKKS